MTTGDGDDRTTDDGRSDDERRRASRRTFLRAAGISAAGLAAGAIGTAAILNAGDPQNSAPKEADLEPGAMKPRAAGPGFDHLVVLMYENRSFDNLLGHLYAKGEEPRGQSFDGIPQGDYYNVAPDGRKVKAHVYSGKTDDLMSSPVPDPGEEYPHVNTQIFGGHVEPEHNAHRKVRDMTEPWNAPPPGAKANMGGFLRDYINSFRADHPGKEPDPSQYEVIMGGFSPQMLPVLSTLARQFAVYDHWHAAVPSQTYCNRSFFHAATSHGFVTNHDGPHGHRKWLDVKPGAAPTIFNRLQDAGLTWRVYYDDRQFISLTGLIHAPELEPYWKTNFATMTSFYDDVASGNLPDYAFIEPRMVYDHNDMHPPVGAFSETDEDGTIIESSAVSDVRAGESLLHEIYSAIRSSSTPEGSNAMNTMLFVTFDEHGGTYDHAVPPAATPPDDRAENEMGFGFDRLGCRVPAIAISAYTAKGHIINDPMHHSTIISTLTTKHGLEPLTDRDRRSPTIDNSISLAVPRQPATWPDTFPPYTPENPEARNPVPSGTEDRPLSPPGVGLLGMLLAKYGEPGEKIPVTYDEAWEAIQKHGLDLFGR